MGKILFVSMVEPCKYGGRQGGPVILLNDIFSVVDEKKDIDLIVYGKEQIETALPINISFIPWHILAKKNRKKSFVEYLPWSTFADYKTYDIDIEKYDSVILYPFFMALFQYKNSHAKFYTIGMDSGPMLYLRGFINHKVMINKLFCLYLFLQVLHIDKNAVSLSEKIFTVGESDAQFYRSVFMADARFLHHPVTDLINCYHPTEWKGGQKLKICFPGGLTKFYNMGLAEQIIVLIAKKSAFYKNKMEVSFLGKIKYKKLKRALHQLEQSGITVTYTDFADDFEEFLSNQHIILQPLLVGAGTKNKTLSALGMGMDLIGTPIALENVFGVKEHHVARTAEGFLCQINKRLENHRLYGLMENEISEFKKYHSAQNWNTYFWEEIDE